MRQIEETSAMRPRKRNWACFVLAEALGLYIRPLEPVPEGVLLLDEQGKAAIRRLAQRAHHAGVDAFRVILTGSVDDVEDLYAASFRAGMEKGVAAATVETHVRGWLSAGPPTLEAGPATYTCLQS
jgi:hypothetical protein